MLLLNSNRKYGLKIYHFTISVSTCLHKTELCQKYCYSKRIWHNVKSKYESNYQESLKSDFVQFINREIKNKKIKWIRIHSIGDFYNQEYFEKWLEIAKSNPKTKFLTYTRNFDLKISNIPSNLSIYYSVDDTTIKFLESNNVKIALNFHPDQDIEFYEHMQKRIIEGKKYFICSNRCANCKACFFNTINIAFPWMYSGRNHYKKSDPKYHNPWYLRKDELYIPRGGLNKYANS